MKRIKVALLMAIAMLILTACGQDNSSEVSPTPSTPAGPDLSGQWEQVSSEFEGRHLSGVISEDMIELYWINDEDDSRLLYWAGTYTAPEELTDEPYSWISRNNTKKAQLSLGASFDKTKEFIYDDETIRFSTTAGDYTCIVKLEKERWAPDLETGEFYEPEYFSFPFAGVEFILPSHFERDADVSSDNDAKFSVTAVGTSKYAVLVLREVPTSQQEYEAEKDAVIEGLCGENAHILASTETLLAGLPAQFISYSKINQYDVKIHTYGALTYIPSEEKALLIVMSVSRDDDYTTYFQEIINSAKLLGASESAIEPSTSAAPSLSGIRPEFKDAMDSYEAFYDEYCALMKQYSENPTDLTLLSKYSDMLSRLSDMDEKFEAWESEDMSNEELKYYLEVTNRVTSKLIDAAS